MSVPSTAAAPGRREFGPTVVVGLAAGVATAVGGNRAWADVADGSSGTSLAAVTASIEQASAPLVTALALVVLAGWGVLLVTRGRFRRGVSWLIAVAAVALVVAAVGAFVEAPRQVRAAVADDRVAVNHTAWAYLSVLAAVVAVVAGANAVRRVGGWPEMGRRYDAPSGSTGSPEDPASSRAPGAPVTPPIDERTNLDLWRDIDEGRDPTDRRTS